MSEYENVEELIGKKITVVDYDEDEREAVVAAIAEGVGFTIVDLITEKELACYHGPLSKNFDGQLEVFEKEFEAAVYMIEKGTLYFTLLEDAAGPMAKGYRTTGPMQACAFK